MNKYFKIGSLLIGRRNAIAPISNQTTNNSTRITNAPQMKLKTRKRKNHIKLMLTMCSISIVERSTLVFRNVYYLFSTDFLAIILGTVLDLVFVVGPSISFFVFYHFNTDFKREFLKIINKLISKIKSTSILR